MKLIYVATYYKARAFILPNNIVCIKSMKCNANTKTIDMFARSINSWSLVNNPTSLFLKMKYIVMMNMFIHNAKIKMNFCCYRAES